MAHSYTPEQRKFIIDHVKGRPSTELLKMFNQQFGLQLSKNQIRAFIKNNGLTTGVDSRFKKGHMPYNKGKKGMGGWEPTHFKKGHTPSNYRPIGSERINVDGYIEIKVADPNKWVLKQRVVWEEVNGPIPKSHAIIFGDGNKLNLDPNNLILVSRKQLSMLNKHNLIQDNAEFTKTGIIVADIYLKIGERKKANK